MTKSDLVSEANASTVEHLMIELDGVNIFYREVGRANDPVILLPHGYPSSSFQFRHFMPELADRWHLIAPDYPGFGYSGTPELTRFTYTFDGYADFLYRFVKALNLNRYALYLHDYGSQIGLRLAMREPERVSALIVQNGDIYEDQLGPKYQLLKDPDLWELSWPLMQTPQRREIAIRLMNGLRDNLDWFPKCQAYLREHQPPTLIVWGLQDGYMPEGAARAYLRDLPKAELHILEGGHWLLETHLTEVCAIVRDFLDRHEHDRTKD